MNLWTKLPKGGRLERLALRVALKSKYRRSERVVILRSLELLRDVQPYLKEAGHTLSAIISATEHTRLLGDISKFLGRAETYTCAAATNQKLAGGVRASRADASLLGVISLGRKSYPQWASSGEDLAYSLKQSDLGTRGVVIADGVQDPGNMGSIVRTAAVLPGWGKFIALGGSCIGSQKALQAARAVQLIFPSIQMIGGAGNGSDNSTIDSMIDSIDIAASSTRILALQDPVPDSGQPAHARAMVHWMLAGTPSEAGAAGFELGNARGGSSSTWMQQQQHKNDETGENNDAGHWGGLVVRTIADTHWRRPRSDSPNGTLQQDGSPSFGTVHGEDYNPRGISSSTDPLPEVRVLVLRPERGGAPRQLPLAGLVSALERRAAAGADREGVGVVQRANEKPLDTAKGGGEATSTLRLRHRVSLVSVPQVQQGSASGLGDSLNVAGAAAILMHQLGSGFRQ